MLPSDGQLTKETNTKSSSLRPVTLSFLLPIFLAVFAVSIAIGLFVYMQGKKNNKSTPILTSTSNVQQNLLQQQSETFKKNVTDLGVFTPSLTKQYRLLFTSGYPINHIATFYYNPTDTKALDSFKQSLHERIVSTSNAICVLQYKEIYVFDKSKKTISTVPLPKSMFWTGTPLTKLVKLNDRYIFPQFYEYSKENYLFDTVEKKFITLDLSKLNLPVYANSSGLQFVDSISDNEFLFSLGGGDACCSQGSYLKFDGYQQTFKVIESHSSGCCGSGKDSLIGYLQKSIIVSKHIYDNQLTRNNFLDLRLIDLANNRTTVLLSENTMPKDIGSMEYDKQNGLVYMQGHITDSSAGQVYVYNLAVRKLDTSDKKSIPIIPTSTPTEEKLDTLLEKESAYLKPTEQIFKPVFPLTGVQVKKGGPDVIQSNSQDGFESPVVVNILSSDQIQNALKQKKPEFFTVPKNQSVRFTIPYATSLSDNEIVFVLARSVYQKDDSWRPVVIRGETYNFLVETYFHIGLVDVKNNKLYLANEDPVKYNTDLSKLKTIYGKGYDVIVSIDKKNKLLLVQNSLPSFSYRIINMADGSRKNMFYLRDFDVPGELLQYGTNMYKAVLDHLKLPYKMLPQNRAFSDYEMQVKPDSMICETNCIITIGVQKRNTTQIQEVKIIVKPGNIMEFL